MNIIEKINNSEFEFILASSSPRRQDLLKMLNLNFQVFPADIDEHITKQLNPPDYVTLLSKTKAKVVYSKITPIKSDVIILAADTIVVFNGEILNKPVSKENAYLMLKKLSGQTHQVFTGYTLIKGGIVDNIRSITEVSNFQVSLVTFAQLSDEEINDYIDTGSPMDKAGAYGIQEDFGSVFVSNIDGDYYNIVGLPLQKLYQDLKEIMIR